MIKRVIFAVASVAMALSLVNCSKENQPYSQPIRITSDSVISDGVRSKIKEESECLSDTGGILERYAKGQMRAEQLTGFWNCIDKNLKLVVDKVKRPDGRGYTSVALTNLIRSVFMKGRPLDPQFMVELLQIKRLFVGGSAKYLSLAEITAFRKLILEFRAITEELRPHIGVVMRGFFEDTKKNQPSALRLGVGREALIQALDQLAQIVSASRTSYTFASLESLLKQIDKIEFSDPEDRPKGGKKSDEEDSFADLIVQYKPLIVAAKTLLVGKNPVGILATEWRAFFKLAAEAVVIWSRYSYFLEPDGTDLTLDPALTQLGAIAKSLDIVIARALRDRDGVYTHPEIDGLFDALEIAEIQLLSLTTEDLKELWRPVVDKVLVPLGQKDEQGYSLANHQVLVSEFFNWYKTSHFINKVTATPISQKDLLFQIKKTARTEAYIGELERAVNGPWALIRDEFNRVVVQNSPNLKFNQDSLATINWMRSLVRIFIKAYATDSQRAKDMQGLVLMDKASGNYNELIKAIEENKGKKPYQETLKEFFNNNDSRKEFIALFEDIRPFLEAQQLIEVLREPDGSRTFPHPFMAKVYRDTALFLPRSDGDHIISYGEGIDYIFYVYAGAQTKTHVLRSMYPKKEFGDPDLGISPCALKDFEYKAEALLKPESERSLEDVAFVKGEACYRPLFLKHFDKYSSHLPEMVNYNERLSLKARDRLAGSLEFTMRGQPPVLKSDKSTYTDEQLRRYQAALDKFDRIEVGDITEIMVLQTYIETAMQRYDTDKGARRGSIDLNFLRANTEVLSAVETLWFHAAKLLGNFSLEMSKEQLPKELLKDAKSEMTNLISYLIKTGFVLKLDPPANPACGDVEREVTNHGHLSRIWERAWKRKNANVLKIEGDRIAVIKALATINRQSSPQEDRFCE